MTGNTLSTQMRRFRKLNARRQIDTPPAPAVRPSAHSSLRPGAGDYFKQADRGEQGRGGRARDERGEKIDPCRRPRSYPRCRSVSSSFHPVSVVVSSVIPSRRGSSRRFIRHPQRVPFPFARRYSFRRRSAPRLVVASFLIRRLVPAPRFLDTMGGAFSHSMAGG